MNSFTQSNRAYGAIQVAALDYVFRLWTRMFGGTRKPHALGEIRSVAAPQAALHPVGTEPAVCGCERVPVL
jgi:hypothetical protein